MKHQTILFNKPYEELTREELHTMIRKHNVPIDEFIKYYNIESIDLADFIRSRGLAPRRTERSISAKARMESEKNKVKFSTLKGIDLLAIRMFRNYPIHRFSKLSRLDIDDIRLFERSKRNVPNKVADIYIRKLAIEERHIIQLREIYTGESKTITDNRHIPAIIKLRVWTRDKGKCAKCEADENLHYHHKKRFSKGGQHTEDNLTLLCVSCHAEEHKGEGGYHLLKSKILG